MSVGSREGGTELDRDIGSVGATREVVLRRLVFGPPETAGRRAGGTVIMGKKGLGVTARIRGLFGGD